MRKLFFSGALAVCFSVSGFAQTKALLVAKISTPTMQQCDVCKANLEEYLKRIDGVTFVNVIPRRKEVTVKFLTDRTNIEMIKTSIANAGYDAAEIAANPESYKMLPKCCKKPEDGGGKPKM